MKKLFFIISAGCLFIACNNEKADATNTEAKMETSGGSISYPYTAEYSSDFKMGDANHSKLVLDFVKCWVDNRMDDMKPYLADSVWVEFPNGNRFNGTKDSLISMGKQFRAMYGKIESTMDGWMPVHSNDKKEDFVLIWGKDIVTDAQGKVDSMRGHSYWLIENNKIRGWSEFEQKLAAPPMEMKK
jgi:hypothetical protein